MLCFCTLLSKPTVSSEWESEKYSVGNTLRRSSGREACGLPCAFLVVQMHTADSHIQMVRSHEAQNLPPNFLQLPSFRNIPTEACRASAFAKDDCIETIRHRCAPNYGALKYSFVSYKYLGCPQFEFDDWRMSTFCWGLCHYAGSGCPVQADECPSQYVERKLFQKTNFKKTSKKWLSHSKKRMYYEAYEVF